MHLSRWADLDVVIGRFILRLLVVAPAGQIKSPLVDWAAQQPVLVLVAVLARLFPTFTPRVSYWAHHVPEHQYS